MEALFDKIPSLSFFSDDSDRDTEAKIIMQKSILKELWFKCSDFEAVVNRAKTLDEFRGKTPHDIADLIYKDSPSTLTNHILLTPEPPSFDILERCPEKSVLDIFESKRPDFHIRIFSVIAEQRKKETSFGEKIEVNFILGSDADDESFEFSLKLSDKEHKYSLKLSHFIELFSNPEINQQFNLTDEFGDKIIDLLKEKPLLEICFLTSSDNSNFFEQLNDAQKKQFLDLLNTENCLESIKKEDVATTVLLILQHHLDQPEILQFAKSVLTKFSNRNSQLDFNFAYGDLTPAFQNLLLEMHDSGEIDLNRFNLHEESKLFPKFDKRQLELRNSYERTSRDSYLKNIELCRRKNIYFNVTKISSQDSSASPLQITLYDLNIESINAIKEKIDSGKLDPSKILSVDVLGVMRDMRGIQLNDDVKPRLLIRFIQLFPNLKHAKIEAGNLFSMVTEPGSATDFPSNIRKFY